MTRTRLASVAACMVAAGILTVQASTQQPASASSTTTAWAGGQFHLDPASVVSGSDIILGRANASPSQSLPLGNGTLGVGAWNPATGFTAQLNRQDTLPDWLSPGWLVIPGLSRLTTAPDFSARLDLYDGMLTESGGGMTLTAYIRADKDELVVNVTGADPVSPQTAWLELWPSAARTVQQSSGGAVATLSATWTAPGAGGQGQATFGMMSGITAGGRDVTASSPTSGFPAGSAAGASEGAEVTFTPDADGSFRVVVVSPHWTGGDAQAIATAMIGQDATTASPLLAAAHLAWWHRFWGSVGLMELSSADGAAQYFENLRLIDLYAEAGENRDVYPGDSSGVALLYRDQEDANPYGTGAWWQWNNRMQVDANIGAGAFSLNDPYFNLYTSNLASTEAWTRAEDPGMAGACVPETMNYDGTGAALSWDSPDPNNVPRCSTTASAFYNTRTITTGAEVGLWIWQQYLYTGDLSFLRLNFPEMAAAAQFLLSYATIGGTDGLLHTYPSNAHESQWDVHDPTTDIAAEMALFPAVARAGRILHQDPALVAAVRRAETHIEPFPRVPDTSTGTDREAMNATLCNDPPGSATAAAEQASALACDQAGNDMIWYSYDVDSTARNFENIGLEPVWPYGVIGDNTVTSGSDDLTALARRTYTYRTNQPGVSCAGCTEIPAQGQVKDWQTDALDAARLGMPTQVESALEQVTEQYSTSPSALGGGTPPFYEQIGTATAAVQEALVQDYDGLLRIAPAWPSGWNAAGTVFIQGGSKVDVQIQDGTIGTVAIQAGSNEQIAIRNPWPGHAAEVVSGAAATTVVPPTSAADFTIPVRAGHSYLVQQPTMPVSGMAFQPVTGDASTAAKSLSVVPPLESRASGTAHIGLAGPYQAPAISAVPVSAQPGVRFSGLVATLAVPADASGIDKTAVIDWGDGSHSEGAIQPTLASDGNATGTFTVTGSHTYASAGDYAVTVTITDAQTGATVATSSGNAAVGPAGPGPGGSQPQVASAAGAGSPVPTAVSLSPANQRTVVGEPARFSVTVISPGPQAGALSGTVQFYADGSPLGAPVALAHGHASLTTTTLWVQSHNITAEFEPDPGSAGYAPGNSPPVSAQVDPVSTSVRLARSGPTGRAGTPVTATVTADDGSVPTGTVQFYAGSSPIGGPVALTAGTASSIVPTSDADLTINAAYTSDSVAWPDSMSGLV